MKELFLLRRKRKTHLLAGNIGTDHYIAPSLLKKLKERFLLRRRRETHLLAGNIGTDPKIAPSPPLEMKEPFLLRRRRRKTHLLAGNIGTDKLHIRKDTKENNKTKKQCLVADYLEEVI